MRSSWCIPIVLAAVLAPACNDTTGSGPARCDSALDCPEGTWCSLSTRTCVEAVPLDATASADAVDAASGEDAPPTDSGLAPACVDGKPCDDGDPCTKDDTCKAGACGGTAYSCDDGLACSANACDGKGGCDYGVAAGQCLIDGACVAAGPDPANACRQCIPAVSQTAWQLATDVPCDDGDPCTDGDSCANGTCASGTAGCDDGNPCTDDACDPETGCTHAPNTEPCDDDDPCSGPDACAEGACVGGEACLCTCASDADCESAAVNPCLGPILCLPGPDGCGTQCQIDATQAIQCDTSGDTACSVTACNPSTATCDATAAPDGTACDDGDPTTKGDACAAGLCAGTAAACTCAIAEDCAPLDDENLCNGVLACNGCECFIDPTSVVTCTTDGDTQCSKTQCAPKNGVCSTSALPDGTPCDDGDPNTTDDVCSAGTCAGN